MRLLNPVAPAENHPNCRRDAQGRPVLPGGQAWQQQLLMLCLSSKARSAALKPLWRHSRPSHAGCMLQYPWLR